MEINNKYDDIKNDLPEPFHLDKTKLEKIIKSKNEKCLICLEIFKENNQVLYLPCSHLFHSVCILRWLLKHNKCPICLIDYRGNVDNDKEEHDLEELENLFNDSMDMDDIPREHLFQFNNFMLENDNIFLNNNINRHRGRGNLNQNYNRRGNWRGRGRGRVFWNARGRERGNDYWREREYFGVIERGSGNWRGRGNYNNLRRFNNRGRSYFRGNQRNNYRGRGNFNMYEREMFSGYYRNQYRRGGFRGIRREYHRNNSSSSNFFN